MSKEEELRVLMARKIAVLNLLKEYDDGLPFGELYKGLEEVFKDGS